MNLKDFFILLFKFIIQFEVFPLSPQVPGAGVAGSGGEPRG